MNVRFDSAREAGLTESTVAQITDGFAELGAAEVAALTLTDHIIGQPARLPDATMAALREHFSDSQIAELALGVGLFNGMSRVLICLGLEPQQMPLTVLPTPGSQSSP